MTSNEVSSETIKMFFTKATNWIELFTSLRSKSIHKGFRRASVTPYMHSLAYHVPWFMQMYKTVKIFTGQGVEKNNDIARNVVLSKSNKKSPVEDVLKLEFRQWELQHKERQKRPYKKNDFQYWNYEIKLREKSNE